MIDTKIISKEKFADMRAEFRRKRQKVVLCHGVYDLLHYGHIEHLREARQQGDILVVSVTAAAFVNKGPGRPYFNDQQRMAFLASVEFVDYVLLSEAVTVHDIVQCAQPDVYVKGQEYAQAEHDLTGNIGSEQEIVERYGGRIYFTQGAVFSSTKLLNNFFEALPCDVIQTSHRFKEQYGADLIETVREHINSFQDLKVLVVGDVIIDEYVFCNVQGVTSKDGVLSTRYDSEERYAGGALAIARHLANFSDHVTLCSMMGPEPELRMFLAETMSRVDLQILHDDAFITPVKRRFLKRNPQRQEYDKLFSINRLLSAVEMKQFNRVAFHAMLQAQAGTYDLVVACDYGHGLMDAAAIRILESQSRFLAVNCQTNSSNHGMNLITKYHRADCFVVDEQELQLAFGQSTAQCQELLRELCRLLSAAYGWLTIGARGAIGQMKQDAQVSIPAVTLHVKDTVGAGDAFYALAVLCAAQKVPVDLATLIGNTAGAIKTNVVGNSQPVGKIELVKFLNTILNV